MQRPDITFAEYRKIKALNPSTLVHGRVSMKHLLHAWNNPGEETDDMRIGTLTHMLCFEPDRVLDEVAVWDGVRRGKEWVSFQAENAGRLIMTEKQSEAAAAVAQSVVKHPLVQRYIEQGLFEYTVQTVEHGLRCKGRIDWIGTTPGFNCLMDLKTCRDARAYQFGASAASFGYHVKMACYWRWFRETTGKDPGKVLFVAAEKKPPFDVVVYEMSEHQLEEGWKIASGIIERVAECVETGHFPGIADDLQQLELPAYAYSGEMDVFDEDDA
jgi:hypothetical protein